MRILDISQEENMLKEARENQTKQQIWGGRFAALPSEIMREINESNSVDHRLYLEDIAGSEAHVAMLAKQGIVEASEAQEILAGLQQVKRELDEGLLEFRVELEDIHMHVESRLAELIGPVAGRLHTGRSRNDQVATDFRLWVRRHCDLLDKEITVLREAIEEQKKQNTDAIMPGFTHLQVAMPVTFSRHLDVYIQMLSRDQSRLADCRRRFNECPLGAGALAGSSYPLDRNFTAEKLDFLKTYAEYHGRGI